VPRGGGRERIDPFRLAEPWRRLVRDAQAAKNQFGSAVGRARSGPLRERLASLDEQIDEGVAECWKVAQAGHALTDARKRIDVAAAQRELAEIQSAGYTNELTAGTQSAIQAQLATAARMDQTITETRDRLRLLNARLDEAVSRAIELSVSTSSDSQLASVGDDLSDITLEMEALRQGLEATDIASGGTQATGSTG
jgi:DNA repair exonuclease SbcCD ATPase subunit